VPANADASGPRTHHLKSSSSRSNWIQNGRDRNPGQDIRESHTGMEVAACTLRGVEDLRMGIHKYLGISLSA